MTIAQCKAARKRMITGVDRHRWKPTVGARKSKSQKKAEAIQRKIMGRGGGVRSVGFAKK